SPNLWRDPPQLNPTITPPPSLGLFKNVYTPVDDRYADVLLLAILPDLDQVARRLNLPIVPPVSTNELTKYVCRKYLGEVVAELELTNGYRIVYFRGLFSEI